MIRRLGLFATLLGVSLASNATGLWLPLSDALLRDDVSLLVDEGVARGLPTNTWPLPAADVERAIRRVDVTTIAEPSLQSALLRVRAKLELGRDEDWRIRELDASAGQPGQLRDAGSPARERAELRSVGGAMTGRISLTVAATIAASPSDGQHLRFDGSEATVRWGNWLFSANKMDRWWGPGWYGSIILSSNARPMTQLSLDRFESTRSTLPILRWFGPWRFSAFVGAGEAERPDVNHPLFMGMRLTFKPAEILEFGLSRSAQFCGSDRPCGLKAFKNVLFGNDNAGLRVSAKDEPGNQMAGFDMRLVSPFRSIPVAIYGQLIGEDNSSSGIPERYLGLLGAESWWLMDGGDRMRLRVEYAGTACKFADPQPEANCAYRQHIFFAGYRFRNRNIGYTADADSDSWAIGGTYVRANGQEFGLHLKQSQLDRIGGVDPWNPLTRGPGNLKSADVRWRGSLFGDTVSAQLGYEQATGGVLHRGGVFGQLQWQTTL